MYTGKMNMNFEVFRLASFSGRPSNFEFPASKLANAGFYYTRKGDEVACFSCNIRIKDWASKNLAIDPLVLHFNESPDCSFLENGNVPFYSGSVGKLSFKRQKSTDIEIDNPSSSQEIELSNTVAPTRHISNEENNTNVANTTGAEANSTATASVSKALPTAGGTSTTHSTASIQPPQTLPPFQEPPPSNDTPPASPFAGTSTGMQHLFPRGLFAESFDPEPDYKIEANRLRSFDRAPSTAIRPQEMARAGFCFIGSDDRVQCAFCKGVLRSWNASDDALQEHQKYFPTCPFIKDPRGVGNVPLPTDTKGVQLRKDVSNEQQSEDFMLGIMTERAYNPRMAMRVEREQSFVNFYSDSQRTPEEFAEAGFYFTGQSDNVKCFFCDGGLRNWEPNDEPWKEHARWFPKCGYLRIKKGDEYIKDIRKRFAPPGTRKPKLRRLRERFAVDPKKLENCLESDIATDALRMGYPMEKVRKCMEQRLRELGTEFPNIESLIDSLQEIEQLESNTAEWTSEEEEEEEEEEGEETGDSLGSSTVMEQTPNTEALMSVADNSPMHGASGKNEQNNKTNDNANANKKQAVTSGEKPENAKSSKKKSKKSKKKKVNKAEATQSVKNTVDPIDFMSEEKGAQLAEEVQKMRDERMCKVCMDTDVNIVFLKCGHLVCCSDCAPALRHCPICRQVIRGTIRVFLS